MGGLGREKEGEVHEADEYLKFHRAGSVPSGWYKATQILSPCKGKATQILTPCKGIER